MRPLFYSLLEEDCSETVVGFFGHVMRPYDDEVEPVNKPHGGGETYARKPPVRRLVLTIVHTYPHVCFTYLSVL